jgi:O-Antigen ligase
MDDTFMAQGAAALGAVGAVLLLTGRTRLFLLLGFALLGCSQAGLLAASGDGGGLPTALEPAVIAAGVAGVAVVAALAALLVVRESLILPLVLLAAPFRLPLDIDRGHDFFVAVADSGELGRLLPLYVVLAAAILATVVRLLREQEPAQLPTWLSVPAATFLAFAALSLLWTQELDTGVNVLLFFLNPFTALLAVAGRAPFPDWMPRVLAVVAVALGCVFAAVGLWQALTEELLFFAPKLEVANTYGSFFRVTSLFRDPSLYGRHLVVAIAVLLVALFLRRANAWLAAGLIVFLWAALYFSYSQSSMVALVAVTFAVTAVAGDRLSRIAVVTIAVFVAAAGSAFLLTELQDESARRVTSDRSRRVEITLDVVRDRPVAGVGLGSQAAASRARSARGGPDENFVSHTTPLTIAAELGLVGLALYLGLLAGAARTLWEVWRRRPALGLALAAILLALTVHSVFYSGFLEDPVTWVALAAAAAALAAPATVREASPATDRHALAPAR